MIGTAETLREQTLGEVGTVQGFNPANHPAGILAVVNVMQHHPATAYLVADKIPCPAGQAPFSSAFTG